MDAARGRAGDKCVQPGDLVLQRGAAGSLETPAEETQPEAGVVSAAMREAVVPVTRGLCSASAQFFSSSLALPFEASFPRRP